MHHGLTQEHLRQLLHYDPESGHLTWKVDVARGARCRQGDRAGRLHPTGYIQIGIKGKKYLAHRLAWLWMHGVWPEGIVDHANGIPSDNRAANLRICTYAQNSANARRARNNTSGYKGVSFKNGAFVATICVNGIQTHLGCFPTVERAAAAYRAAAHEMNGPFARTE